MDVHIKLCEIKMKYILYTLMHLVTVYIIYKCLFWGDCLMISKIYLSSRWVDVLKLKRKLKGAMEGVLMSFVPLV